MDRLINFLSQNKVLTWLLAIAFYLTTVVFHDEITKIAIRTRKNLTLPVYDNILLYTGIIIFLAVLVYSILVLKRKGISAIKLLYLIATLILVVTFFKTLLVTNIEFVHFGQYMILAILLFPVIRNYGETIFWVTIMGVLDETYQYTVLTTFFLYFDFNDIILNEIGAGLGLVLIFISVTIQTRSISFIKRSSVLFTVLFFCTVLTLYFLNEFTLYPPEDIANPDQWIILNRTRPPSGFWTLVSGGRYYHIIRPLEGIVLMGILFVFYSGLDRFSKGQN